MGEPRASFKGDGATYRQRVTLTAAQAMAVRVAVSSFDADCGDDEHGKAMAKAYTDRLNEVFRMMVGKPA